MFNKQNEKLKACATCREKKREWNHSYGIRHRAELTERTREDKKQYYNENKEQFKEWHKQYRERDLNKEVPEKETQCTMRYKTKPVSEYGEEREVIFIRCKKDNINAEI